MNFYVVYLESGKYIALKRNWVQNPILGEESMVFLSKDESANPNFSSEQLFYVNKNVDATYKAFVYKRFGITFIFFFYKNKSQV